MSEIPTIVLSEAMRESDRTNSESASGTPCSSTDAGSRACTTPASTGNRIDNKMILFIIRFTSLTFDNGSQTALFHTANIAHLVHF